MHSIEATRFASAASKLMWIVRVTLGTTSGQPGVVVACDRTCKQCCSPALACQQWSQHVRGWSRQARSRFSPPPPPGGICMQVAVWPRFSSHLQASRPAEHMRHCQQSWCANVRVRAPRVHWVPVPQGCVHAVAGSCSFLLGPKASFSAQLAGYSTMAGTLKSWKEPSILRTMGPEESRE